MRIENGQKYCSISEKIFEHAGKHTRIYITDIQHFSVGNGAGIRTTVFFKGCNLKCPWCHNPETISFQPVKLEYAHIGKTEWCGKEVDIKEVLKELSEDKDYYRESGGGVTFSGGEVMLQVDGAIELAKLLKAEGISLTVDTAGNVPYSSFQQMNPYADEYLYDFKTGSPEKMQAAVGGNMERIIDNLKNLLRDGKKVRVRIPLIPDFNTAPQSVQEIAVCLQKIGIKEVDLLPFHRMGSGKYEAMGLVYPYKDTESMSLKQAEAIAVLYAPYFKVNIEK